MYLYHTSNVEIRSPDIHYGRINADRVCLTNLNRQILATRKTVICPLVRVMRRECRKRGIDSHPGIDGVCPVSGRAFSQGITSSGAGT